MAYANVCPFTDLRYIAAHGERMVNTPFLVITHTNAGSYTASNDGMYNYINTQYAKFLKGQASAPTMPHWQVGMDRTNQWLDINERGVASYKAEGKCVSIETADQGSVAGIGPWNPYQVEMLAQIMAWMHAEWGIPLQFARVPLPTRIEDGGLGWHSMWGVNTASQPNLNPWTTQRGKTCPTAPRIAQMQQILDRAIEIATPTPLPPPTPNNPVRKKKMYLIQYNGGAVAVTDGITKRGVLHEDIAWLAYLGLVVSATPIAVSYGVWSRIRDVSA